jgi:hypothetical protein
MDHDEQRVRTMAGWIGVEISRSRVRTPGKAGYGLYRVRGSRAHLTRRELADLEPEGVTPDGQAERFPWTAYAFTLEQIERAVQYAISRGTPQGPQGFDVRLSEGSSTDLVTVPTRWTTAYRGRRDLGAGGEPVPAQVKPEFAAEVSALDAFVGAGLMEMRHVEGCACDDDRYTAACVRETTTPRQRQRADNAAFQAEHLEARAHGLRARYAAKMERSEKEREGS